MEVAFQLYSFHCFNPLNRVILTTHGVISKLLLKELECKLTPQKCRFTLTWSHFDSSLALKCHFDPTTESKRLLKSKWHTRGVKMTLQTILLKWLLLVKTTVLNLQCTVVYQWYTSFFKDLLLRLLTINSLALELQLVILYPEFVWYLWKISK